MNEALKRIAGSFAEEYCSDAIYPAHLFKAVLHKEIGLVKFIESELDKDYYYLQDWADIQMQLSPRATRPQRDLEYSRESEAVIEEAENYMRKFNLDECTDVCVLASLVTPGVGFSFGVERVVSVLKDDGLIPALLQSVEAYVMPMGEEAKVVAMQAANSLRMCGIITDYCFDDVKLGNMFKRAEKKHAKVAIIIGENEVNNNKVIIKNLQSKEQIEVDCEELCEKVADILSQIEEAEHAHDEDECCCGHHHDK